MRSDQRRTQNSKQLSVSARPTFAPNIRLFKVRMINTSHVPFTPRLTYERIQYIRKTLRKKIDKIHNDLKFITMNI